VGALQDGNPGNGPSTILIKLKAGCILPWHWHTSNERIIMITGSAKAEMKDASPLPMEQGDFLVMPSKHIHQFTATTDVEFYDISETTFDIHYVDSSGSEISVAVALNAVNESVTK
jgi:quercetin dioxygenase-like cupin family protein